MDSFQSKSCIICGDQITSNNDSREHVIPNAIGGRLKTKGFICSRCNSTSGQEWDSALAKQLQSLCLFFDITRERGQVKSLPVETTAGERFVMLPGGGLGLPRPTWTENKIGERVQIQISARNFKEVRQMLNGVRRRFPASTISHDPLDSAAVQTSYPEGLIKLSFSIGGILGGRSIVKTAAAFAHHSGIPVSMCNLAKTYLCHESESACFGYYFEHDLIACRPLGVPFHCVSISGDPSSRRLFGYVEYFGGHRMVVSLSDIYDGPSINASYAIDPTTGQKLDLSVQIPSFSTPEIADIYDYKRIPEGSMERAYSAVLSTGIKRQFEAEKQRAISDAVEFGFKNCGAKEGEIITAEHARAITGLMIQRMMPFLLHRIRRPERRPNGNFR